MKTLSSICKDTQQSLISSDGILCDYVTAPGCKEIKLEKPMLSTDFQCKWCQGKTCYTPWLGIRSPGSRTLLCSNTLCDVYTLVTSVDWGVPTVINRRAVEWPLFCEINNMGDSCHQVRFEGVNQSSGKIDYMRKFAEKPGSVILMQGDKGLGKTYSAMAICELYTRTRSSAMFMTQKQMLDRWMETFKADKYDSFIDKVKGIEVLVVDDFGTGELSKGFLTFFMDLINTRTQWTNRGTVITTNLDDKKIAVYCGGPLADRLTTGQKFFFEDNGSRRVKTIL